MSKHEHPLIKIKDPIIMSNDALSELIKDIELIDLVKCNMKSYTICHNTLKDSTLGIRIASKLHGAPLTTFYPIGSNWIMTWYYDQKEEKWPSSPDYQMDNLSKIIYDLAKKRGAIFEENFTINNLWKI